MSSIKNKKGSDRCHGVPGQPVEHLGGGHQDNHQRSVHCHHNIKDDRMENYGAYISFISK